MKKFVPPLSVLVVIAGFITLGWWLLRDMQMDVLMPSGAVAEQQKQLLIFACILSAVVVIPVFIMLASFAWRFREGNKRAKYRPHWNSSKLLEAIWWTIPVLIIVVLGTVTWFTSHSLDPYKELSSTKKPIEVKVIALQWKWLFIYPEEKVATLNKLVVPVGTPVHFTLSADAPMSAFWIPSLGSQIYAMNGMSTQLNLVADKQGTYRGYSTNINGPGYADMTFAVSAKKPSEYVAWSRKAGNAQKVFDMALYHQVAKAKTDRSERVYRVTESGLYDSIVKMHMGGHSMGAMDE